MSHQSDVVTTTILKAWARDALDKQLSEGEEYVVADVVGKGTKRGRGR